jgi:hypothetical protein
MAAEEKSVKQTSIRPKRKAPKTAFKPGQSGNPNGRPKKKICIPDLLREIGNAESDYGIGDDGKRITRLRSVLLKVYQLAEGGNLDAVKFIADRTEGKALERVRINDEKDELIIA